MSVTRVNEFRAREGSEEAVRAFLTSLLPLIEASAGCRSCRLIRQLDDPARFVVLEEWDSPEAHRASVKNISPALLQDAMKLLAGPPSGAYFEGCSAGK